MSEVEWAILLDLDQTLVLTADIESLRQQREWQKVYKALNETRLPDGTKDFIAKIRRLASVGVVTTSPRPYAEKLLAYHHLEVPVLIAYHDITRRKPDPEPILSALRKIGVPSENAIYVGDQVADIQAASNAGVVPIGLSWDGTLASQPGTEKARAVCTDWTQVYAIIDEIINMA